MKYFIYLILTGLLSLTLSGCLVAESSYLKSVEETDTITKDLGNLKLRLDTLTSDNKALNAEHEKLKLETAALTRDKQTLQNDKELLSRDKAEMEKTLKAKPDALLQNISDLRMKITRLETTNSNLESANSKMLDDTINIQKIKEERVKEVSGTYEQLLRNMKSEIAKGQVTISELRGKLTIKIESAILYDTGKSELKPHSMDILIKIVETFKGVKDKTIRIAEHTSNNQITGALNRQLPANWELSSTRAINIAKYLQLQGLDPVALSAAAIVEHTQISDNDNKEGREKRHHIEITLVNKD